jgi:hypothetical protein
MAKKKRSEFGRHLVALIDKVGTHAKLADSLGVSDSRIPEWIAGKRLPPADAMIALGRLALEHALPDPFFFWAQAGVDAQVLQSMADKVLEERYRFAGETIPVLRFRDTKKGREDAGAPVPLPAEFVPNPRTTICLSVDEMSSGVVDAPGGLYILDISIAGTTDVRSLHRQVVLVRYTPEFPGDVWPEGIYAGRLMLNHVSRMRQSPDEGRVSVTLHMLTERRGFEIFHLGSYGDPKALRGVAWEDHKEYERRLEEIWGQVESKFPLRAGVCVLGRVIGRLTGHKK